MPVVLEDFTHKALGVKKEVKTKSMTAIFGTGDIAVSDLADSTDSKLIGISIAQSYKVVGIGELRDDPVSDITEQGNSITLLFENKNKLESLNVVIEYLNKLKNQFEKED